MEKKGSLLHCWWECKPVQPLWEIVWRFLKKLHIELPYDPANLVLGIDTEKTINQKDTCSSVFTAVLFAMLFLLLLGTLTQTRPGS